MMTVESAAGMAELGNAVDGPRLSIVITAWDAATTIETALASVLDERWTSLECVVVDDGSTDETADVVRAVAQHDPRVTLIRSDVNEGVSGARNRGLAVARGEWLTFLDADDRLLPGGIAALMRPTADPAVKVVVGQRIWTDGERRWLSPAYDIPDIREPGRASLADRPGLVYYASATGKLFHRSLVGDRRFAGRVLGDQPWTIHALLQAGGGIEVIDATVYEWRRPHPDRYVATITAETKTSAARATEMARVAQGAWGEVALDVDASLADEDAAALVKRTYFERLVRSDIADRLRAAADRRDPATAALYDAVGAFLTSIPTTVLTSSDVHLAGIVRSAGFRYAALEPGVRAAYWRMIRPVLSRDPRTSWQLGGNPAFAAAFWLARTLGTGTGERLGAAVLLPTSAVALAVRRLGLA